MKLVSRSVRIAKQIDPDPATSAIMNRQYDVVPSHLSGTARDSWQFEFICG